MIHPRFRSLGISLLIAFALLAPTRAFAQLQFTLDSNTQSGVPGNTLTFAGTLTNTDTTELFLNGNTFSLAENFLTLDDSLFFSNFPVSLLGGETVSGDLFTVAIGAGETSGLYAGSFTIVGGSTDTAQTTLATKTFTVNVAPSSAAPEPGSLALLLLGAGTAGMALRKRRRK